MQSGSPYELPHFHTRIAISRLHRCKLVGVPTDDCGLNPVALESILRGWDEAREGASRPRVLYTIPSGSNPTGASLDLSRKRRVYELAQEFGLLILEDDPYHWLMYEERVPSLLSLDVDGRVLRFDSFSKLLAAGLRVGFATGPRPLIERLQLHTQAANLHSCGLSQALVSALFDEWARRNDGDAIVGFEARMSEVRSFYYAQREAFLDSADRHLTGLATWSAPTAGMFV